MADTAHSSSGSKGGGFVGIVIGLIMMVAGTYASVKTKEGDASFKWHADLIHALEGQGIPLDLGKTIASIGVLLILFPVIRSFFVQPLSEAINSRNNELESTFSEAESLRSEMGSLKSDYEKRLASTEASAREQIQAQIKDAQAFRDQLKAEASGQAEEYKKRAMSEIDAEKNAVLTDLRVHVVNLTMQATEKVIGENMDNERNRKLVDEFIDKLEVPV